MKNKLVLIFFLINLLIYSKTVTTELLVAGGGASGTFAAIQAARSGTQVLVVEETSWLGGMLTSAGVGGTDGNHELPSGLWGEFRNNVYKFYGGADKVFTSWVSYTIFEPQVGAEIIRKMVAAEKNITVFYNYHIVSAIVDKKILRGAIFVSNDYKDTMIVNSKLSIDATELGDLLAKAGCNYFVGQDSKAMTGEDDAPIEPTDIIQDITYVAILKDYGKGVNMTVPKPANYNPSEFFCTCRQLCDKEVKDSDYQDCDHMLRYGKMPNGKYMINWPFNGNDYYLNSIEMSYEERLTAYEKAKEVTMAWIYYMQTNTEFNYLGLADDVFPTNDLLAFQPYHRESRRVDGIVQFREKHIINPYDTTCGELYKQGIVVGDYPLDLHHKKCPKKVEFEAKKIPSYNIPYGCLVPKTIDGLIVAEKSISVTHITNGCTRLQPVVILIGQAAGEAAALCLKNQLLPRALPVTTLQASLLKKGCWMMPYLDVTPESLYFEAINHIGLSGIMRGEGKAIDWSNETRFYPDNTVKKSEFANIVDILNKKTKTPLNPKDFNADKDEVSISDALVQLWQIAGKPIVLCNVKYKKVKSKSDLYKALSFMESKNALPVSYDGVLGYKITRKELAFVIDKVFNPFEKNKE